MSLRSRRTLAAMAAFALLTGALAACTKKTPDASATSAPAVTTTLGGDTASPSPSAAPTLAAAPTCAEAKQSVVTGIIDPYYAYGDDGAPLLDGIFSGEDGLQLEMQAQCATGDVGGDIGNVTIAVIKYSMADATGRWWTVLICKPGKERAKCVAQFSLNDREPIESVKIADQKLTIVYLTRTDGASMAELNIRRTAIWAGVGTILKEQSHTDAAYKP